MIRFQIPEDSGYSFMWKWLIDNNFGKIVKQENLQPEVPVVIVPKSLRSKVIYDHILKYKNYVMIEHAYWSNYNFKKRQWYRIAWKSMHNFTVKKITHSRKYLINWPQRNWINKSNKTLIVVPGSMVKLLDTTKESWISATKEKFCNLSDTTWRYKPQKKGMIRLNDILSDFKVHSHVYTHTSVAAVEAALYDIPVTCSPFCAAYPVSQIENPISKDLWLEHLAWSQFHVDEFRDGTAWELTFQYQIKDNE